MTDLLTQEVIERLRVATVEHRNFADAIWLGTTYHDRATIMAVLEADMAYAKARAYWHGEGWQDPAAAYRFDQSHERLSALISVEDK